MIMYHNQFKIRVHSPVHIRVVILIVCLLNINCSKPQPHGFQILHEFGRSYSENNGTFFITNEAIYFAGTEQAGSLGKNNSLKPYATKLVFSSNEARTITWGGSANSFCTCTAIVVNDNQIFITGYFYGHVNFSPDNVAENEHYSEYETAYIAKYTDFNELDWVSLDIGGNALKLDNDSNIVAFGNAVANLSSSGAIGWSYDYGVQFQDALSVEDGYIVAGIVADAQKLYSKIGVDVDADTAFIGHVNRSGELALISSFGENGLVKPYAVAVFNDDSIAICGEYFRAPNFSSTNEIICMNYGNSDAFVAKYSSTGELLWILPFGGARDDTAYDLIIDDHDELHVTGKYYGNIRIKSTYQLPEVGSYDAFYIQLDSTGNVITCDYFGVKNRPDIGNEILLYEDTVFIVGAYDDTTVLISPD